MASFSVLTQREELVESLERIPYSLDESQPFCVSTVDDGVWFISCCKIDIPITVSRSIYWGNEPYVSFPGVPLVWNHKFLTLCPKDKAAGVKLVL